MFTYICVSLFGFFLKTLFVLVKNQIMKILRSKSKKVLELCDAEDRSPPLGSTCKVHSLSTKASGPPEFYTRPEFSDISLPKKSRETVV